MSRDWTPIAKVRYDAQARRAVTELQHEPLQALGADPHRIEVEIAAAPRHRGTRPPLAAAPADVHFGRPHNATRDGRPPANAPATGGRADAAPPPATAAPHDGQTAHMPSLAGNIFHPGARPAHNSQDPNATPIGTVAPPPPPAPQDGDDDMEDSEEIPVPPPSAKSCG